ncbi:MAG: stage II sporulation protein P [Tenericutes bacterium]|nr:stage II sporulation protein P [Mycoplasmatota bacterium]
MRKMRLKNNNKKSKKLRVIRIMFLITIIYISFSYSFYYSLRRNKDINNSNFIKSLVRMGNSNNLYNNKLIKVVNSTINFITHVDVTKPSSIITSYVSKKNNYDSITLEHNDDYSNLEELKKISSYIEDPYKVDISKPIIYLYNTHQLENYNNKNLSIYNITPNVLMASYILKEKLNKNGIFTIVEDTNLSEFLNLNHWNYASSYKATRMLLLEKMNKYDSLKYFIDIHRDSVNRNSTTVTINNKNYAKILFVVGLEHKNYEYNLEVTNKLNDLIKETYPSLTKGIYKKSGKGVDGIYNQDVDKNCILIEIGGVDNTIEEVYNTLEVLSNVLTKFVGGV